MRLRHLDIQNFNTAIAELYATALEQDPLRAMVCAMPHLIGGSLAVAQAHDGCFSIQNEMSEELGFGVTEQITPEIMATHPCMAQRTENVVCISDVISRVVWRENPLYKLFRPYFRLEDDIGVDFKSQGVDFAVCVVSDAQPFGDRERGLMNLLRPHLKVLANLVHLRWRSTEKRSAEGLGGSEEVLHVLGEELSVGARAALEAAYPRSGIGIHGLPWPVEWWLAQINTKAATNAVKSNEVREVVTPLFFHADGLAGRIEYLANSGRPAALLLRYRWTKAPAKQFGYFGLSPREIEVLHWLAQGKTNFEMATLLGIAGGTVKRHLENIYSKLGVENRAAAMRVVLTGG